MRTVPSLPLVGAFAGRLLAHDLPGLDPERRGRAVAFAAHRIDTLPSVMRLGVLSIATVVRIALLFPGRDAVVAFLARTPLPLIGEYVRLIRSLGFAYIWETWPDTRADGRLEAAA